MSSLTTWSDMYRKIAVTAAILTAGLMIGAPAFAALTGGAPDRPSVEPDTTTTTAKQREAPKPPTTDAPRPIVSTGPGNPTTTAQPTDRSKPPVAGEERREVEQLRLACHGGRSAGRGAVKCSWSPSHAPTFARYVLWRQDPDQPNRLVVFESTDRNTLVFYDLPVDAGNHYYKLLALDRAGRIVGSGGPVSVTVPPPPPVTTTSTTAPTAPTTTAPKPGTMAFGCMPTGPGVVCKWPASTSEQFGSYRLYREVPGTRAQLRLTITDRHVTTATDNDVQPGQTYTYRLVTLNADGQPLAYSDPVTVTIPSSGPGDAAKP